MVKRVVPLFLVVLLAACATAAAQKGRKQLSSEGNRMLPQKVSDYLTLLDSYRSPGAWRQSLKSMPLTELKRYAKITYEADEADPLAIDKQIEANRRWNISPAYFRNELIKTVKRRLSIQDFALVGAPCWLEAKILNIKTFNYKVEGGPPGVNVGTLPKTEVTAVVKEVIKGHSTFHVGDTITFYYYDGIWRPTRWNFKLAETCLLPLGPLLYRGKTEIALVTTLDGHWSDTGAIEPIESDTASYGRYPKVNGKLIDRDNFFGFGRSVRWKEFRSDLLQRIKEIEAW